MIIISFVVGFLVGGIAGVFCMAIAVVAKDEEERNTER